MLVSSPVCKALHPHTLLRCRWHPILEAPSVLAGLQRHHTVAQSLVNGDVQRSEFDHPPGCVCLTRMQHASLAANSTELLIRDLESGALIHRWFVPAHQYAADPAAWSWGSEALALPYNEPGAGVLLFRTGVGTYELSAVAVDPTLDAALPELSSWSSSGLLIVQHSSDTALLSAQDAEGEQIASASVDRSQVGECVPMQCFWAADGMAVLLLGAYGFWVWEVFSAAPLLCQLEEDMTACHAAWAPTCTRFLTLDKGEDASVAIWSRQGQMLYRLEETDSLQDIGLPAWGCGGCVTFASQGLCGVAPDEHGLDFWQLMHIYIATGRRV